MPNAGGCGNQPIRQNGIILPIPVLKQEQPNWCTIAVFAMMRAYFLAPVRQCDMANERAYLAPAIGTTTTATTGNGCCDPEFAAMNFCTRPTFSPTDFNRMFETSGLFSAEVERALTEQEIQAELSNGRPVLISYQYDHEYCKTDSSEKPVCYGHSVLLSGFLPPGAKTNTGTATSYIVLDPADGSSKLFSYARVLRGPRIKKVWPWSNKKAIVVPYPWMRTRARIAPHVDGCVPSFVRLCDTDSKTVP